jgi:hypothetical protein
MFLLDSLSLSLRLVMVSVTRKMNEHTNMCLVASKKRWRQLWHNALEISKGFELQVANFSNLSLSRVQETETEVETEAEERLRGHENRRVCSRGGWGFSPETGPGWYL